MARKLTRDGAIADRIDMRIGWHDRNVFEIAEAIAFVAYGVALEALEVVPATTRDSIVDRIKGSKALARLRQ